MDPASALPKLSAVIPPVCEDVEPVEDVRRSRSSSSVTPSLGLYDAVLPSNPLGDV